ncbi:integrase [Halodesulfurarchaeum formicicum]|uniref:Integrase n=1 Tax=Halodesulfurarchaeum formicicum TaxID=1873524 RepID=A0A1J1ADH4_9EURY|nr:integrase [Halodesulfurarchaeum formicicum]
MAKRNRCSPQRRSRVESNRSSHSTTGKRPTRLRRSNLCERPARNESSRRRSSP